MMPERLGLNPSRKPVEAAKEPQSETRPYPTKIYSCKYCRRMFYSSQALGGHQNAHKRERGLIRHFQANSMSRSLWAQAHAHKPGGDETAMTARFGMPWQPPAFDPTAPDIMWPGSFMVNLHQHTDSSSSGSDMELDLNLKL